MQIVMKAIITIFVIVSLIYEIKQFLGDTNDTTETKTNEKE